MNAVLALKRAVYAVLSADVTLAGFLGGPSIFDHPPPAALFPYITFGRASQHEFGTATEPGSEILLNLDIWSRKRGSAEALAIAETVRLLLHDAPLVLDDHHLVNLRQVHAECDYDDDAAVHRAGLLFRAVTEPAG